MNDTQLKASLQCVLAGPSRAALMTALTAALGPSLSSTSPDEPTAGMPPIIALRSVIIQTTAQACMHQRHGLRLCTLVLLYMMQSVQPYFWHADIFVHGRIVGCCHLVRAYCTYILFHHVQAQNDCVVIVLSCAFMHQGHGAHRKADAQILKEKTAYGICIGMLLQVLGCRLER